jgi:Tol biopolymer transport system component
MLRKIVFIIILSLIIASPMYSQNEQSDTKDYPSGSDSDPFNLMEFETDHFIFIYPKGWNDITQKVARIAENAHAEVTAEVGYAPDVKTHFIIQPYEETANGSALPYLNIINIYLQRPDFLSSIDSYLDGWLDFVITHEIVHNVHLGSGNMYFPIPNFLIEGYAVYLESILTSGGRVDSAYGDMVMRTQVMYDDFPTIDEASMRGNFIRSWPIGNISYIIGGYFFKYLYETYGGDAVRKFNQLNRSNFVIPWIEVNARKTFGRNFNRLWKDFESWAYKEFTPQIDVINLEKTNPEYDSYIGYAQTDITTSTESEMVYFRKYDPHYLPALYSKNYSDGSLDRVKRPFLSDDMNLSDDGSLIAYSLIKPDTYYYHRLNDIYLYNTATNEDRRITIGNWASNPDISPDNSKIVYSRANIGGSAIVISEIDGNNPQVIIDGGIKTSYRHPAYSHDGKRIAFIKAEQESARSIMLYDIDTGEIDELINLDGIKLSRPVWSEDDTHLILSTDRSGIFNIYLLNIETVKLTRVTNLTTGGINPIQKGNKIYFSYYTNEGYELRHISYTKALQLEADKKTWQFYDSTEKQIKTEAPFGNGQTGLRNPDAESGYEDLYPKKINITDERNYITFFHFKNIIPIIHFIPTISITDDGILTDISTIFYDVTFRSILTFGVNLTIPSDMGYVTIPELLGGYVTLSLDLPVDIDFDITTNPIIYAEGGEDYIGRTYRLGLGFTLPWRGLGYDSYSIGISTRTVMNHEYNTDGFSGYFKVSMPFRMSRSRFNTIMGFRPVFGFYMRLTPSLNIDFETGNIIYSAVNVNELNLPMFLPDSVTTLRLSLGYADPPPSRPYFKTGGSFKLRSGRDVVVEGNKIVSFSIDSASRLFRLDRGIYPIPLIFQGSYINFTFDMAMGFEGNIQPDIFNYIVYGTGVELVFEFAMLDSIEFDLTTYLYIDPFNFVPMDAKSYNFGIIIDIPLLDF